MSGETEEGTNSTCSMTGLLGIIIQITLGVLSFSVLILKRFREFPQRPWKIWIFDTSKQLVSQLIAHFINLTISIALTYNDDSADECLWYLTTNILDNSLGVLICVFSLWAIQWSLKRRGRLCYVSGNYYSKERVIVQVQIMDFGKGEVKDSIQVSVDHSEEPVPKNQMHEERDCHEQDEPYRNEGTTVERESKDQNQQCRASRQETQTIDKYQVNYQAWLVQLLIWVSVVVMGKIALFGFEYGLRGPLKRFSFLVMGWIESYPVFQLLVVIVIVPVAMNGLAFWVQDNFLMKKQQFPAEGESPLIEEQNIQNVPKEVNLEL